MGAQPQNLGVHRDERAGEGGVCLYCDDVVLTGRVTGPRGPHTAAMGVPKADTMCFPGYLLLNVGCLIREPIQVPNVLY